MKHPSHEPIRPFAEFITETNRGNTHAALSAGLHDLVEAVRTHGRAGTLTLTVKVAPLAKGDDSQFSVAEEISLKAPKADPRPSVYFADRAGNLTTSDPSSVTFEEFNDLPDRP
jgi:hypothetical protein